MKKKNIRAIRFPDDIDKKLEILAKQGTLSSFIIEAVKAKLFKTCPTCHGKGVLPEKEK